MISFGGHTENHVYLTRIPFEDIEEEVVANQKYLEDIIGEPIEHFCLPGGQYTKEMLPVLYRHFKTVRTADTMNFWLDGVLCKPTFHMYPRGVKSLIGNACRNLSILDALFITKNSKKAYFDLILDMIKLHDVPNDNSTVVIWGHSWELEEFGLWDEVGTIMQFIANSSRIACVSYGITVNDKRGRYSYKLSDREKPISARMLGTAYDREYLLALFVDNAKGIKREKAANDNTERKAEHSHKPFATARQTEDIPKSAKYEKSGIRLVVDLENCIKAQQSRAYAQKVKISNLQQMADTYAFVKSHGYASVEELETALNEAKAKASAARTQLKGTESRLNDVNKQIRLTGQYLSNKDIYAEYRKSGKSEDFYEHHRAAITLYETARDNLREMSGGQKLLSMKSLREEKDRLVTAKNAEYEAFQNFRTEQRDLQTVYTNVRKMLGMEDERSIKREQKHEID